MTVSTVPMTTTNTQDLSDVLNLDHFIEDVNGKVQRGSLVTMTVADAQEFRNRQLIRNAGIGAAVGFSLPLIAGLGGIGVAVAGIGFGIKESAQCALTAVGGAFVGGLTAYKRPTDGSRHSIECFRQPVITQVGKVIKTFTSNTRGLRMATVKFTTISGDEVVTTHANIRISELVLLKSRYFYL